MTVSSAPYILRHSEAVSWNCEQLSNVSEMYHNGAHTTGSTFLFFPSVYKSHQIRYQVNTSVRRVRGWEENGYTYMNTSSSESDIAFQPWPSTLLFTSSVMSLMVMIYLTSGSFSDPRWSRASTLASFSQKITSALAKQNKFWYSRLCHGWN